MKKLVICVCSDIEKDDRVLKKTYTLSKKFDLIVASGPSWHSFYLAEYLFEKYNIPFILDYRDPWISQNKKETNIQKRIISKAKTVVTVGEYCAKQIKDITKYNKKINIIENGVDLNYFKKFKNYNSNNSFYKIGYAGSFINYQKIDDLLYAINKLPQNIKSKIIFEACGGPFEEKYKKLAKKLNINANFYGYLNLKNMICVLNKCDLLYIGHTIYNAIGGKLYIYLSLNKNILIKTKKDSQLDKLVKKNKLGLVSYSIDELKENIKRYYLYKTKYNYKENINIYIVNYDWKKLSKKYSNLFDVTIKK